MISEVFVFTYPTRSFLRQLLSRSGFWDGCWDKTKDKNCLQERSHKWLRDVTRSRFLLESKMANCLINSHSATKVLSFVEEQMKSSLLIMSEMYLICVYLMCNLVSWVTELLKYLVHYNLITWRATCLSWHSFEFAFCATKVMTRE